MAAIRKVDPKQVTEAIAEGGRNATVLETTIELRGLAAARMHATAAKRELKRAVAAKSPAAQLAELRKRVKTRSAAVGLAEARAQQAQHKQKAGAHALGGPTIYGRVVDASGEAVVGVAVGVSTEDGKPVSEGMTDAEGYFLLTVPRGPAGDVTVWVAGAREGPPAWQARVTRAERLLRPRAHLVRLGAR